MKLSGWSPDKIENRKLIKMTCSLSVETWWDSFKVLTLENDLIKVILMPQRGGEIHQITWKMTGFKFLCEGRPDMPDFHTPSPGIPLPPAENYSFSNFYTMFPNAGQAQDFLGYNYEFHGDIRSVAWEHRVCLDTEAEIILELTGRCKEIPFQLKRMVSLKQATASLNFMDEISHTGPAGSLRLPFIYGFHPYFSLPLIDQGTLFKVDEKVIFELPSPQETVGKLFSVDTGEAGLVEVYNPALNAAFRLKVDSAFLKYTWLWFASRPAQNVYIGSLLPCTNYIAGQDGINSAVKSETALWLEPGQVMSTKWQIETSA
jgi:galactose mutarotase-like enzyme